MKKEELIASRVPEGMLADLKRIEKIEYLDRSAAIRRLLYKAIQDWKLEYGAKLYGQNKWTLGRAAEEAGVSVREMMEYLQQKKTPMQYDTSDFEADFRRILPRSRRLRKRNA